VSRVACCIGTLLLLAGTAGAQALDPKSALAALGFPADVEKKVLAGQFVRVPLPSHFDGDISVGIAFLVRTPPARLLEKLREDRVLLRLDPQTIAYGPIEGEGSPEQLAALKLTPAQLKAYAAVAPGDALNLSRQEIASLQSAGHDAATLGREVRELLLARYRAYRVQGLGGIAPYARKAGQTEPAAELGAVVRGIRASGVLPAALCDLLADYPKGAPADLAEVFQLAQFTSRGTDTLSLVHSFQGTFGGHLIAVQRYFYVSTGFNVTHAIVGFLPAPEGTLVLYTNHTSTDQVRGIGAGTKRSIGRSLMSGELEKLFKAATADLTP